MSIASEITRLQNAKSALKTSINAKTDSSHQIDDETLDEYSDFVDSIQTGGGGADISEYLDNVIPPQTDEWSDYVSGDAKWLIKKLPDNLTLGTGINDLYNCFNYFYSLESIPLFDTSNVEDMSNMCYCCYSLVNVPLFDTSKVISLTNAFSECQSLSNESLNNILAMCTNTPNNYDRDKCLENLGLSQEQITICHGLSNYQAFLNAGWRDNY